MPTAKTPRKPAKTQPAPPPAPEPKPPTPQEIDEAVEKYKEVNAKQDARKVVYDKLEITEYSSTSKHGPLTVEDVKTMLWWETEKEYQERMVKEVPSSKPEHWLFGDVYHCLNTKKEKVRCWNNANNRPFDMSWCEELIHTILYGHWAGPMMIPGETVNGETVRISRYGRVLSGQHQGTALVLAKEYLDIARSKPGYSDNPKYPAWEGHKEPVIETIVITGLSEDERVLRTIDYVKPRTTADMLYTMELFRQNSPVERKEMTRMLAAAIDLLWQRTDTKGYKTHPEVVGFLERHKRLLKCVEHIFVENSAKGADGGRKISKLRISAGHAAALCYLMACGSQKTTDYSDEYRNESPPSERNLDWSYWDQALDFWTCLAGARDFIPVRMALGQLVDSTPDDENNQGLGGRMPEKLAILARAWERFKDHTSDKGPAFDNEDLAPDGQLCLTYTSVDSKGDPLPNGKIELVDIADFYGIDCPKRAAKDPFRGQPEPPPPTKEEIERATEEALKRRQANQ